MGEGEFSEALEKDYEEVGAETADGEGEEDFDEGTEPSLFGVCLLFFWEEVPCLELTLWCEVDAKCKCVQR